MRPSSGAAERLLADGLGAQRDQASVPRTAIWALCTLVTRYLHAYGPAAPQHFARWWLAIPPRFAAGLFGTLADALERVELDSQPRWTLAGGTATPAGPRPGICLLPYFDACLVVGQLRDRLYPAAADAPALTLAGQARTTGLAGRRRGRRGVASAALRAQNIRSARLERTAPKRLFRYRSAGLERAALASSRIAGSAAATGRVTGQGIDGGGGVGLARRLVPGKTGN